MRKFKVGDPVRISQKAIYDPHNWNDFIPFPWRGKPGFYTKFRNVDNKDEVLVSLSNKEQVFVNKAFLEPRKLRRRIKRK